MITWLIIRAGGIAALVALFAAVTWGLLATTSVFGKRFAKASGITIHQYVSTVGLVFTAVHVVALLVDSFMPFGLLDVAVPWRSEYRPGAVALGIFSMYSTLVVLFTSWLKRRLSSKIWRALHTLAVPAFAMAVAHGIAAGSDTGRAWMWWLYASMTAIVLFLTLLRGFTAGLRPTRAPLPARATPGGRRGPTAHDTDAPERRENLVASGV